MEALIFIVAAFAVLDLASLRWGVDSRFGPNDVECPYGQEWHIWS